MFELMIQSYVVCFENEMATPAFKLDLSCDTHIIYSNNDYIIKP